MCIYLDHPFTFPAGIKHKPFQAKYERIEREGQTSRKIRSGTVYRDSQGRSRREFFPIPPKATTAEIVIDDPVGNRTYFLDAESKTAFSFPSEDSTSEEPLFIGDNVGRRIIEGFECRGYRINLSGGGVMEYWVADDLLEILFATYKNKGMESTIRHFDIQRREPQAGVFVVPSDYTEVKG